MSKRVPPGCRWHSTISTARCVANCLKVSSTRKSFQPGNAAWPCCTSPGVQTFGLTLALQDDAEKIAAYRRFHQSVWPEVTARLRACGVHNMQIVLRGTRLF